MIIVTGTMPIKTGSREAATAALVPLVEATRAEAGNLAYRFGFDVLDDHLLHFYEEWDSEEALTAHFGQPHVAQFGAAMQEFGGGQPTMAKHVVA